MIQKNSYSTLQFQSPAPKKAKRSSQVILTPLKGTARRDSVEIIGEDAMTPVPQRSTRRRSDLIVSRPSMTDMKQMKVGSSQTYHPKTMRSRFVRKSKSAREFQPIQKTSMIGAVERATVNRMNKEDINIEELEWTQYHVAIFEGVLVFFVGSDCRFESRVDMKSVKTIKRIRIDKKAGLMLVLSAKPVSIILRFRSRDVRQQWYQHLCRRNSTQCRSVSKCSTRLSERSYNLAGLDASGNYEEEPSTPNDAEMVDDVFSDGVTDILNTAIGDTGRRISSSSSRRASTGSRARASSCPTNDDNVEGVNCRPVGTLRRPSFYSLRKVKRTAVVHSTQERNSRRTLFDSIKQKANKIRNRLTRRSAV